MKGASLTSLSDILDLNASLYGGDTALIFGARKITYRVLYENVLRFAAALIKLGIRKGDKAAILLENCPHFVMSYFAIVKIGAIVVPINHMLKLNEVQYVIENARIPTIITSPAFYEMCIAINTRTGLLRNIILTAEKMPGALRFFDLIRDNAEWDGHVDIKNDDTAVVIYTSGTTGKPKGSMLTHGNLISNAQMVITSNLKISHRDVFICILPLFHAFAATTCMLAPLLCGAQVVLQKTVRPFKRVLRAIRKHRVTILIGIPSLYNILCEIRLPFLLRTPLIRLFLPMRVCVSGAASLPEKTLREFESRYRIPLIEGYGLTEASPVVSINPIRKRKPCSVGLPINREIGIRIVGDDGKDAAAGEAGELLVKGPTIMKGYFDMPHETAEALAGGWLHTGDIVKLDEEGYIYIAGRKKEMINVRGLKVYPREIEDVLYRHEAVKEAAVIGVADPHKGEAPKAFVVLREGRHVTGHEFMRYLRENLANYKVPHSIEIRDALPKNATGKILKQELS